MQDITVVCHRCGAEIALTESLAAPILEASKREFENKLAAKDATLREKDEEMAGRRIALELAEASLDFTIEARLRDEIQKVAEAEARKAKANVQADIDAKKTELEETHALLKSRTDALQNSRNAEATLRKEKRELDEAKIALEAGLQEKLDLERGKMKAEADRLAGVTLKRIEEANRIILVEQTKKLDDSDKLLASRTAELEEAKKAEAEFIKTKRLLDDEKRNLEVTIQQRLNVEISSSRQTIRAEVEKEAKLQLREKDAALQGLKSEIESLKKKSEQGSQQLQGEVWEREIYDVLTGKFVNDRFRRVAKGESGADIIQEVYNQQGKLCGTLLWESKRTKHWSDEWLLKLKKDQRNLKADTAIIVSHALPRDLSAFELREDVWVTGPDCLLPVAGALRHLLIEVFTTKRAGEGQQDKAALIYQYVTSVGFRQRVRALVETYSDMQNDLKSERKAIQKQWAKRESQMDRMLDATTGMYGDLQGIAGRSVPEIDGIGFEALDSGS